MTVVRHVIVVGAALSLACASSDITSAERALLDEFRLGDPPPDPSNAFAESPAAASLGQQFFFDTRFSGPLVAEATAAEGALGSPGDTGRVACASCHDPANGGTDHRSHPANTSLAAGWTGRNAPTCYNTAWSTWLFWDGRKDSVWSQAIGPVESPVEHNGSRLQYAHLIYDLYRGPYEATFGAMPDLSDTVRFPATGKPGDATWSSMTAADQTAVNRVFANMGKAIAAYERLLVSRDSPFDRWLDGEEDALSSAAIRGAKLFVGRAACNECHRGGNFSDNRFHNLGVPQAPCDACPPLDIGRAGGIAGVVGDTFNRGGAFSDAPDTSHLGITPTAADEGAFKTPTLRSVSRTAPYMHDGAFGTLREVVLFYRDGGGVDSFAGTKDPAIKRLALSDQDVDDLVEFLRGLDGAPLPTSLVTAPVLP